MSAFMHGLAKTLAVLGGIVLVAVTAMTVASITGRALIFMGLGPVPGDFELVQVGVGFAVFAFLPWCQLNRGHATVDILAPLMSGRVNRLIDLIAELLMTIVLALIAWQLYYGMMDKLAYTETSFILQFPIWWAYAACLVASVGAVIVSVYMVFLRAAELSSGVLHTASGQGASH
ncbi:TRAP transporter small permease subunit [Mesorhizobium sp. NBSH29]|uniref:TRAP transporter small permease n=1 Tax=Mesorhizobium sp. NBSH29 TaxID=2654249 RepID=UPI0018967AAB|nr:TRAP transporter small permease [Mesorhizobium sp. NBSH29]QPC86895.1 TRAP transporter small permease subunit [Mesorhizobium sp. NBSH29]